MTQKVLNIFIRRILWAALILLCAQNVLAFEGFEGDWEELKGEHFIVYVNTKEDLPLAKEVLSRAEGYYDSIARNIGYARYAQFWTWDDRAKIYIFPDQTAFVEVTKQPAWSRGYVARDQALFKSRMIVTYKQEEGFLDGLLPHEIAHLILRDAVGFDKELPLWFEEGIAQLHETGKQQIAERLMKDLLNANYYIPITTLMNVDINSEKDPIKVAVFYAQSLSLVDFLIKKYGSDTFGHLCQTLRDGRPFESALRSTYVTRIDSLKDFEKNWMTYMKGESYAEVKRSRIYSN